MPHTSPFSRKTQYHTSSRPHAARAEFSVVTTIYINRPEVQMSQQALQSLSAAYLRQKASSKPIPRSSSRSENSRGNLQYYPVPSVMAADEGCDSRYFDVRRIYASQFTNSSDSRFTRNLPSSDKAFSTDRSSGSESPQTST